MTKYRDDQLTDWFPPHIKPVHVGAYETAWGYSYWDGAQWGRWHYTPHLAMTHPQCRIANQSKSWRGLNFNPQAGESEQAV